MLPLRPTEAQIRCAQFCLKRTAVKVKGQIERLWLQPSSPGQVAGVTEEDLLDLSRGEEEEGEDASCISKGRRALLKVSQRKLEERRRQIAQLGFQHTCTRSEDVEKEEYIQLNKKRQRRISSPSRNPERARRFEAAFKAALSSISESATSTGSNTNLPNNKKRWRRSIAPSSTGSINNPPDWVKEKNRKMEPVHNPSLPTNAPLDRGASWLVHLPKKHFSGTPKRHNSNPPDAISTTPLFHRNSNSNNNTPIAGRRKQQSVPRRIVDKIEIAASPSTTTSTKHQSVETSVRSQHTPIPFSAATAESRSSYYNAASDSSVILDDISYNSNMCIDQLVWNAVETDVARFAGRVEQEQRRLSFETRGPIVLASCWNKDDAATDGIIEPCENERILRKVTYDEDDNDETEGLSSSDAFEATQRMILEKKDNDDGDCHTGVRSEYFASVQMKPQCVFDNPPRMTQTGTLDEAILETAPPMDRFVGGCAALGDKSHRVSLDVDSTTTCQSPLTRFISRPDEKDLGCTASAIVTEAVVEKDADSTPSSANQLEQRIIDLQVLYATLQLCSGGKGNSETQEDSKVENAVSEKVRELSSSTSLEREMESDRDLLPPDSDQFSEALRLKADGNLGHHEGVFNTNSESLLDNIQQLPSEKFDMLLYPRQQEQEDCNVKSGAVVLDTAPHQQTEMGGIEDVLPSSVSIGDLHKSLLPDLHEMRTVLRSGRKSQEEQRLLSGPEQLWESAEITEIDLAGDTATNSVHAACSASPSTPEGSTKEPVTAITICTNKVPAEARNLARITAQCVETSAPIKNTHSQTGYEIDPAASDKCLRSFVESERERCHPCEAIEDQSSDSNETSIDGNIQFFRGSDGSSIAAGFEPAHNEVIFSVPRSSDMNLLAVTSKETDPSVAEASVGILAGYGRKRDERLALDYLSSSQLNSPSHSNFTSIKDTRSHRDSSADLTPQKKKPLHDNMHVQPCVTASTFLNSSASLSTVADDGSILTPSPGHILDNASAQNRTFDEQESPSFTSDEYFLPTAVGGVSAPLMNDVLRSMAAWSIQDKSIGASRFGIEREAAISVVAKDGAPTNGQSSFGNSIGSHADRDESGNLARQDPAGNCLHRDGQHIAASCTTLGSTNTKKVHSRISVDCHQPREGAKRYSGHLEMDSSSAYECKSAPRDSGPDAETCQRAYFGWSSGATIRSVLKQVDGFARKNIRKTVTPKKKRMPSAGCGLSGEQANPLQAQLMKSHSDGGDAIDFDIKWEKRFMM